MTATATRTPGSSSGTAVKQKRPTSAPMRFVKSPRFARSLFLPAVLVFWIVANKMIENSWDFDSSVLATPREVWDFMVAEVSNDTVAPRNLYQTFGISLKRLGIGFAISMILGTAIGLGMGLSKAVNAFFHDWVMGLLAMPALAWALFLSLIFGFDDKGPILAVILAGIPFVIVNVREGVRSTPRDLFDMSNAFDVPSNKRTRHVLLPSLYPFLFASARYALSIGWKGLVIIELFGGQDGAGWTVKFWYDAHRLHGVIGYSMFFVIFALLLENAVLEPISRRVFRWRPSMNTPEIVEEDADALSEATDLNRELLADTGTVA
ncbi:MAG: ABC-type nitrate/sulfonate/bicarbonate transport system permease component [Verrucomicrobiales bacterium]|jgi:ABC-type nitrate/sulfonate/bicarbonate transport system permease component